MMALFRGPGKGECFMAQEPEPARKTLWRGVALGLGLSCFAAYQQFKLPPVLPDLLREFPHGPAIAAGFMSIYALIGLLVSQPLGRWLQGAESQAGLGQAGVKSHLGLGLALAGPLLAGALFDLRQGYDLAIGIAGFSALGALLVVRGTRSR